MVSPLVVTKAGIIYGAIITGLWLMERVYHPGTKNEEEGVFCNGSLATEAWVDEVVLCTIQTHMSICGVGQKRGKRK